MTAESGMVQVPVDSTSSNPNRRPNTGKLRRNASWDIFHGLPQSVSQDLKGKHADENPINEDSKEMLTSQSMDFKLLSSSDGAVALRRQRDRPSQSQGADFDGGLDDTLEELPTRSLDRREVLNSARFQNRRNAMKGVKEEEEEVPEVTNIGDSMSKSRTSQLAF